MQPRQESSISDIIRSSLENVRSLVDSDTIIGQPIATSAGTTIIPVSKVSVGIASGGVDINSKKAEGDTSEAMPQNFGGGGGTGLTVSPVCFLVVYADGKVEMLNVAGAAADPVSAELSDLVAGFIHRTPEFIVKIKDKFKEKKTASDEDAVTTEETEITAE